MMGSGFSCFVSSGQRVVGRKRKVLGRDFSDFEQDCHLDLSTKTSNGDLTVFPVSCADGLFVFEFLQTERYPISVRTTEWDI